MAYIDRGFVRKYTNSDEAFPVNMNLNSKLFMNFDPRSCLLFRAEGEGDPSMFILPSLLSVIELIRIRWHSTIIINGILDLMTEKIEEFADFPMKILNEVINNRTKLVNMLEDPMAYSWGGGSLNVLYNVAIKQLWIERLEKKSIEKISLIDKIYIDSLRKSEWLRHARLKNMLKNVDVKRVKHDNIRRI
jgi:hypothetical protein